MNESFSWLWRIVAIEEAPWILSAIIFVLALIVWLSFRRKVENLARALDRMTVPLAKIDGPSAFKQKYSSVFAELAVDPLLGEYWRAYASTFTGTRGGDGMIGYARRPKEVFNEQLLTAVGIDMRFYSSVPNLLVGMGLLFSFVGLVSALYFASFGVASASIGAAQTALAELLAVATFKFLTSIAGLSASLLFSWGEKRQLHKISHRLSLFCTMLEARTNPVTSESLMLGQLERLRSIENHVSRLSRAVYVRVPQALEDTLAEEMREALVPLHNAIAAAARSFDQAMQPETLMQNLPAAAPMPESVDRTVSSPSSASPRRVEPRKLPRQEELTQLADSRFGRAIDTMSKSLQKLGGGGLLGGKGRQAQVSEALEHSLMRLRDLRQAVTMMHENLTSGNIDLSEALATLQDVDHSLGDIRQRLQQADDRGPSPTE